MPQVVYSGSDGPLEIVCEDGSRVVAEQGQPVEVPEGDEKRLLEREDFKKQVPAKSSAKKESD